MQIHAKPADLVQRLTQFENFQDLPISAIDWLVERGEYYTLEPGEFVLCPEIKPEYTQFILKGNYLVYFNRNGQRREAGTFGQGYITGILPFSRMKETVAYGKVLDRCEIFRLHKDHFVEMVNVSYELTQALVAVMSTRIRDFSQLAYQDEKLLALGKLSAGLAHELNNPASAMVRSSEELYKAIHTTPEKFKAIITMDITPEETDQVNTILFSKIKHLNQEALSIMEREERMDDLLDWMDDHEVDHADEIAETFLDFGLRVEELDQVAEIVSEQALPTILWWIESTLNLEKLVTEIRESADRISGLIKAIKGYSYMDKANSMEAYDVQEGLQLTMMILKHKFKDKQIQVAKEFTTDLPQVNAYGGQLNQVWTNLIANAIDAMDKGGTLTVRTKLAREKVWVQINDNGSGIPKDIISRIWEPFFTTKGMNEGTGMGLDIVQKLIKVHGGNITVTSQPGNTTFEVSIPVMGKIG
ncbi:MAG: ATP-binding protein [Bacteroidota bacterium]